MNTTHLSPVAHKVGARFLAKPSFGLDLKLHECTLLEWAPSKNFVRLNVDGSTIAWYPLTSFEVVEVLNAAPNKAKR